MSGQQSLNDLLGKARALLEQTPPAFDPAELEVYVQAAFDKGRALLTALQGRHAPPLYVLERAVLTQRAARLRRAFEAHLPSPGFYYAMKSNNHPLVSAQLLGSGFGLDVSSGVELSTALELGASDIVFSGPGKTAAELELAVAHASRVTVLMDSPAELERLEAAARHAGVLMRAGVRLTPNPQGLWRKFGVPLARMRDFWEKAIRCEHIDLRGIQFHTSWNMDPGAQIGVLENLGRELAAWPASLRERLEFLDIGGGFWPPQGEWLQWAATPQGMLGNQLQAPSPPPTHHWRVPAQPIETFAQALAHAAEQHIFPHARPRICLEPGRWICNDAVQILVTVIDRKDDDMIVTDAGTNAIGWDRFESDYAPVLNLTRPALREFPCWVFGSLCTPHDLWGYTLWGHDVQPGDILMIPDQGAYTYSLRQEFIKPLPPLVMI